MKSVRRRRAQWTVIDSYEAEAKEGWNRKQGEGRKGNIRSSRGKKYENRRDRMRIVGHGESRPALITELTLRTLILCVR